MKRFIDKVLSDFVVHLFGFIGFLFMILCLFITNALFYFAMIISFSLYVALFTISIVRYAREE